MSGVLLLRQVIGTQALTSGSAEHLETILGAVFAAIFETPVE